MFNIRIGLKKIILLLITSSVIFFPLAQAKTLHLYNWSDYIAPDTIPEFAERTNISVSYDVFDSNEVLDGKLMAGNTGFDLVVPTDSFLTRQIHSDIYQPLDKQRLTNYHHLDKNLMNLMAMHDPANRYSIPYMWQSTGIGYNIDKVKAILGEDVKLDSWDLIFDVANLEKLSQCGVAILDAPSEIFPTILNYLGKNPNSTKSADYRQAAKFLEKLRPYIMYFHSSKYITDLSSGDICVAIGWSGDVMQAADAAHQVSNHDVNIGYIIPKEGAIITFDAFAIPKDARNIDEAYLFLDYLLEPEVIAKISNHVFYPNANRDSLPYLDDDIVNNPSIYPPHEVMQRLFPITEQSPLMDRLMVRLWTKVLSGI